MDVIFIDSLAVDVVIGVYDWEQRVCQQLLIDVELMVDASAAGHSDELAHTIDYSVVAERLVSLLQEKPIQLIEAAAERCAALLIEEFGVAGCRVRIAKPGAIPDARAVGIVIERGWQSRG